MKKIKYHILTLLLLLLVGSVFAQGNFNVHLDAKNMHYWRGLRVSDGFVTAPMVGYYNQGFAVFAWGGLSLDGQYKEVSQIISYSSGNFNITLLDIFNFTGAPEADYFNFKADETNHIVDLSLGYDFTETLPLRLMLATIVYGNDRDSRGDNRYSTYLEAGFPFQREGYTVQPFAALGFALNAEDDNSLYGNNAFDLVNIGLRVGRRVEIGSYTLPVTGTLGFNPSLKQASVEIALTLF
ncbi:MAG: hypothetical protein ACK4VN_12575 [Bacteroidales bacterium]